MIAIIGVAVSSLSGEFEIGSYFEGIEFAETEVLLEYISLGMAFLTLAIIFVYLIVRAANEEKELYWDFEAKDIKAEDFKADDD